MCRGHHRRGGGSPRHSPPGAWCTQACSAHSLALCHSLDVRLAEQLHGGEVAVDRVLHGLAIRVGEVAAVQPEPPARLPKREEVLAARRLRPAAFAEPLREDPRERPPLVASVARGAAGAARPLAVGGLRLQHSSSRSRSSSRSSSSSSISRDRVHARLGEFAGGRLWGGCRFPCRCTFAGRPGDASWRSVFLGGRF